MQINTLFDEVIGFEEFMLVLANNAARDSIYGMVYRVSIGAMLSLTDAATDIYVIATYYRSDELRGQADALVVMIAINLSIQIAFVFANYSAKKWTSKLKEVLICLLFLRPPVDAYRVGMADEDEETATDRLDELIVNKGIELAIEGVPGCILQVYVWLTSPEEAGTYALVSILCSALTTGYTSAIIAFDIDIDIDRRKNQPKFYGYVMTSQRRDAKRDEPTKQSKERIGFFLFSLTHFFKYFFFVKLKTIGTYKTVIT